MPSLEQHLFGPGPKRILALDGGGVRGLLALGILKRIEDLLAPQSEDPQGFRLSDYFDLIAGASTGSIIATGLALGWTVDEVKAFYDSMCPPLFPTTQTRGWLKFRRDAIALGKALKHALGDTTLGSNRVKTGLMICAKRIDTDSAWVLTNNPKSKYWASPTDEWFPNRDYTLAMIVRASAAAPTYFEPVRVEINKAGGAFPREEGLFIDGAISGHNCPALQAFFTATLKPYGFNWPTGADKLLVISVGTGSRRERQNIDAFLKLPPAQQAVEALKGMITESVRSNLLALQAMSEPRLPWPINGEIGGLDDAMIGDKPLLSFQRYDASLEESDVVEALNLHTAKPGLLRKIHRYLNEMDCGRKDNLRNVYQLGLMAGGEASMDDFPAAFDGSVMRRSVTRQSLRLPEPAE